MSFVPTYPDRPRDVVLLYVQVLQDTQISNYLTAASYALLIFDVCTTLDSEFEFVWKAPFSRGTILYSVMRYGTVVLLTSSLPYHLWPDIPFRYCQALFYIDIIVGANLTAVPVSALLALRTYALYQRRKIFKWILVICFTTLNLVLFTCLIVHLATVRQQAPPSTLPGWTCPLNITYASSSIILTEFSAPVVYESIIFILTANRVYELWSDTRIVKVIFWDCLLYYTVILLTSIASLLLLVALPENRAALRGLFMNPLRVISVILAARLVLRLRRFVAEPNLSLMTLSAPILPFLIIAPDDVEGSHQLKFSREERRFAQDKNDEFYGN